MVQYAVCNPPSNFTAAKRAGYERNKFPKSLQSSSISLRTSFKVFLRTDCFILSAYEYPWSSYYTCVLISGNFKYTCYNAIDLQKLRRIIDTFATTLSTHISFLLWHDLEKLFTGKARERCLMLLPWSREERGGTASKWKFYHFFISTHKQWYCVTQYETKTMKNNASIRHLNIALITSQMLHIAQFSPNNFQMSCTLIF